MRMYLCVSMGVNEKEQERGEEIRSNRWSLIGLAEKCNSLECWCDSIEKV